MKLRSALIGLGLILSGVAQAQTKPFDDFQSQLTRQMMLVLPEGFQGFGGGTVYSASRAICGKVATVDARKTAECWYKALALMEIWGVQGGKIASFQVCKAKTGEERWTCYDNRAFILNTEAFHEMKVKEFKLAGHTIPKVKLDRYPVTPY